MAENQRYSSLALNRGNVGKARGGEKRIMHNGNLSIALYREA